MNGNENLCLRIPVSLGDCGDGGGSITRECCESIQASLDTIIERLTKIQECVCDCDGGVIPDPGYSREAIGVILPESGTKDDKSLYRVDKNIENVASVPADYFNKHPLWSGIVQEEIDGQAMIKIPAFAYKRGVAASGPNEGKKYLILAPADTTEPGFERHPAFMKDGQPIEQFWVGAYQACADPAASTKLGSVAGTMPLATLSFNNIRPRAYNRNVNGVEGFMMWSIYQLAAIQMLCLVEIASSDVQKNIGQGRSSINGITKVDDPTVATATYRGIVGLWGNIEIFVDGARTNSGNKLEIWDRSGQQQYVAANITMPGAGYINSMKSDTGTDFNLNDVFLPEAVSGAVASAAYPDAFRGAAAGSVCFSSGAFNIGDDAGIFFMRLNLSAGYVPSATGTRIAKI